MVAAEKPDAFSTWPIVMGEGGHDTMAGPPASRIPPFRTSSGAPVVPLTEEQRFRFDKDGWLLIPGVLSEEECAVMRAHCYALRDNPEALPAAERSSYGGPLAALCDHPVLVGWAQEFLAHPTLASEETYGFRMEMSFLALRTSTDDPPFAFSPHNGSGLYRLPGATHTYHSIPGKAHAGLARAVWELNPVGIDDGGTMFITGSHKSAFGSPAAATDPSSSLWDTYSCPAGSLVLFTEGTSHSGQPWTNAERDRCAVFNAYNALNTRWSMSKPPEEQVVAMPKLRASLFREATTKENRGQYEYRAQVARI